MDISVTMGQCLAQKNRLVLSIGRMSKKYIFKKILYLIHNVTTSDTYSESNLTDNRFKSLGSKKILFLLPNLRHVNLKHQCLTLGK